MRALRGVLGIVGGLAALFGLLYLGYGLYVERIVSANPSTVATIDTGETRFTLGAYSGGDQVASDSLISPESTLPAPKISVGEARVPPPEPSPQESLPTPSAVSDPENSSRPILPPTLLKVPKIKVSVPVVLVDNENLPKFKGAGWFLGSGYPGFRGNVVLVGHLNGEYEVFSRLAELRAGDEVEIAAFDRQYWYRVVASSVVRADALEVLAPTTDFRLTLITCAGTFYPETRDYSHRLVVTARLVDRSAN